MEPEMIAFLIRIVQTISMALLWMLVNMTIGIYWGFGFFVNRPSIGNYLFYIFFLTSLAALIFYFKKKWKGKL
jgi:hypothetical protein